MRAIARILWSVAEQRKLGSGGNVLTPIQIFRGVRAVARLTTDPTRLDEVFVLADLAEESPELERMLEAARSDPAWSKALAERPRLGRVDLDALALLPEGTIGRGYADFMRARGLSHEDLLLVEGEGELDFVRNHLRETHDIWHVATGFDTDVAGELGLQAFYLAQLEGPLPVLLLTVGMLHTLFRAMPDARRRMDTIARGWRLGKRERPLFGVAWAERWRQPVEAFRREHAIDPDAVDAILADGVEDPLARAA
jgi:ubiquinone biosynthesis protein Coq4